MITDSQIKINESLWIPATEIRFSASGSSGPGGQHVNRVNTRISLRFDIVNSKCLTEEQKVLLKTRLASRINREGILQVVSQGSRSQATNRADAVERFAGLVKDALIIPRKRKKVAVPESLRQHRIDEKKHRARKKTLRSKHDISKEEW
ncbi:alternative ribosome rescue aminoacyl-tRNA hydrolase ArfB [Desulfobacterales bacterium HSG16]|nr:alternative ribosome rescue aminoacyl-tRNA hydrolase ArfB [Desulfobacterales bacterium HSG16]